MPESRAVDPTSRDASDRDATFLFPPGLFPPGLVVPRITISVVDAMYSLKPDPEDNWLWFAFAGFMRLSGTLRTDGSVPRAFAAVGSGNGLDAIGAAYAFPTLRRIVVTDVDEDVVRLAVENVRRNVPGHMEVIGLTGDVCDPIATLPFRIDLVYANLPNIPAGGDDVADHGTFFRADGRDAEPGIDDHLLGLQRRFLLSAPRVLAGSGLAILMIGGRFPVRSLDLLAHSTGFAIEEVLSDFKLQTEAENVTSGYADAETSGITFDFYRHDEGKRIARRHSGSDGARLKRALEPCRLTAREAAREVAAGRPVGHVVHVLTATPRA